MTKTQVLHLTVTLIQNPAVQAVLLAIVVGAIPKSWIQRFPVLRSTLALLVQYTERVNAENASRKVGAASHVATVVVQGLEQLKAQGKLDSGTAVIQAQSELVHRMKLHPEFARILVEQAVKDMRASDASGVKALQLRSY